MNANNGWKKTTFGELATLVKGISYTSEDYCGPGEGAVFITIKCVSKDGGFKREGIKYYKGIIAISQILRSSELLIANTDLTRAGDIVGCPMLVPTINGETITMSMDLSKLVIDDEKVDRDFLYYKLMTDSVRRFMKDHASGSTVLHLQTRAVPDLELEIPTSKPDQTKIAEILFTVDRAIEQTEALIAKQQRIKTGLMQDLLTCGIDEHGNIRSEQTHEFKDSPLGRIPVEWDVVDLSVIIKRTKRGPSLSTNNEKKGIIYLTSDNISDCGDINWQIIKYLDVRPESLNSILEIGDVILNCVNSEEQIGKLGFVDGLIGVTTIGFNNFGLTFHENIIFSKFAFYQMSHGNFQHELRKKIKPAINQSSFSSSDLADIPFVIPQKDEQRLIADKLDGITQNINYLIKTLYKIKKVKTALMQDLLTGKKRVTQLLKQEQEAGA